jgi:hypothetical protein
MIKMEEQIIFELLNDFTKGYDVYYHDGSMWYIFTEDKKWLIELDKKGTLWYNYPFFSKIFKYVAMERPDFTPYITKWVEDAIQNGVKDTAPVRRAAFTVVEDAIQNGVKDTLVWPRILYRCVEDAIQNGVKDTRSQEMMLSPVVEDAIQNGVKNTYPGSPAHLRQVEDTIQNGVKNTGYSEISGNGPIEEVIQNGIKN